MKLVVSLFTMLLSFSAFAGAGGITINCNKISHLGEIIKVYYTTQAAGDEFLQVTRGNKKVKLNFTQKFRDSLLLDEELTYVSLSVYGDQSFLHLVTIPNTIKFTEFMKNGPKKATFDAQMSFSLPNDIAYYDSLYKCDFDSW